MNIELKLNNIFITHYQIDFMKKYKNFKNIQLTSQYIGLDGIDLTNVFILVEKLFNIKMEESEIVKFNSFNNIMNIINNKYQNDK